MKRTDYPEPPATYAHVTWDDQRRRLAFEYNGRTIITVDVPSGGEVKHRIASDGLLQSSPVVQQTFVAMAEGQCEATVTFHTSPEAVAMRPGRARADQAIVGTAGGAIPACANGLYDVLEDLLVSWHGRSWRWLDGEMSDDAGDGAATAKHPAGLGRRCSLAVNLADSPWLIVLKPMYYREHLGYRFHEPWKRRPNTKPVAGWCSWEAYRREVSQDKVLATAEFLAGKVGKYGLEYIQVDDGYQRLPVKYPVSSTLADAWLKPNERFASGFDEFCRRIKALGLKPGLWISADAEEIEKQPDGSDVRLRGPDGQAVKGFWMRAIPDCLPETIDKHIVPLYRGIVEKGFDYVKTDQIRHLLSDALHEAVRSGILSNDEARSRFRNYMERCRESLGDDVFYLASWGVLSEVIGVADACRISADASTMWRAVRMQAVESARWWHAQRILFQTDADHICVRTNAEWARSLLSLLSLSGQMMMMSDPVESYDDQRIDMMRRTLPPLATYAGETGPLDATYAAFTWCKQHGAAFKAGIKMNWDDVSDDESYIVAGEHETMHDDHPLATLWAFHLSAGAGTWCVAYRFAGTPLRASTLSLEQLGLDAAKRYVAFDFWAKKCLGEVSGTIDARALPLGHCQAIALREVLDRPQFLASTRHVSMDAVSVKSQTFDGRTLALEIAGVEGTSEEYFFHCPAGWSMTLEGVEGGRGEITGNGACTTVRLSFAMPRAVVRFACTRS